VNCTSCGNTGFVKVERGPAGATYTVLGRCSCQIDTVTIPRAQHEALRAAAKALKEVHGRYLYDIEIREKALVALRAAGIQVEDEPNPSSLVGHAERKS
jgi:hypothetical protein